jgi:hypothetical protein
VLKELTGEKDLFINNEVGISTKPKANPGISIIDLSLTTTAMRLLQAWVVDQDHPTGSGHELQVIEWVPLERGAIRASTEVTGWQIQTLQADLEALEKAA